jgi:hypothetical protein
MAATAVFSGKLFPLFVRFTGITGYEENQRKKE